MEWLQKILSNAVYGEDGKLDVEATVKKVNEEAPKHIVPKEQYNSKVKELDTANATIGDLKKANGDNEELQNTIKTHEATIKQLKADHETEMNGIRIDSAISKALADNKAKHADLLAGKFDREKLQLTDDGKVIGMDEQLKSMKETYKDMFTQTISGQPPLNPDGKPSGGNATFDALVNNADTMSAEEVAAQFAAMEKQ
ncbi:MAG: hypothetical protein EOM34_04600 [Clostridia bacterium]|nr:hypothetical protein [Clostridia bacterium]NCD41511.1 hypothetical protein [Bacteroidia bacterium]